MGQVSRSGMTCRQQKQEKGDGMREFVDGREKYCVNFTERDVGWKMMKNGVETKAV